MEIFKLFGSIMVDSSAAEASLQKTDDKAESTGKTMSTMGDKVATAAFKFNNIVSAGKTVINALGNVYGSFKNVISGLDDIDKGSKRMGVSAEYYQELAYASELCGVEMSTMEKAAKKLEGTGVTLEDAMADIMSLETAEERTARASELFGETVAYTMEPLLQEGAAGFDAMRQEANDLGLVLSGDMVKDGAAANDAITKMQESLSTAATTVLMELSPYITEFCEWLSENMPGIIDAVVKGIEWVIQAIKDVIKWCKDAWDWLTKVAEYQTTPQYGADYVVPMAMDGVPGMAVGGIVTGPQLTLIGEAGPEMVVPLDPDSNSPYAASNIFGGQNEILKAILEKMDKLNVVLDSGVIAGAVNSNLAKTRLLEVRGV